MPRRKKLVIRGSNTAKCGFRNEDDIVNKFNDWKDDEDAQRWLELMGYPLKDIEYVKAIKLHGYKTDIQAQITIIMKKAIAAENISVKLVSNPQGFNQVDKRWIKKYEEMWNMPDDIAKILKLFTGEIKPNKKGLKDSRRMLLSEMPEADQIQIVNFFEKNKFLVILDILKGRGKFAAEWMLVAQKCDNACCDWSLTPMNQVLNIYGEGEVRITNQGSLKIGKVGMQRKGGDAGRKSAQMLQFKINPIELFNEE